MYLIVKFHCSKCFTITMAIIRKKFDNVYPFFLTYTLYYKTFSQHYNSEIFCECVTHYNISKLLEYDNLLTL